MALHLGTPITPCLWFDHEAEDAARFYISLFEGSTITNISYYGEAGTDIHGQPKGKVLTVAFELGGRPFTAMNGGPHFKLNEAVSLQIFCETQAEIDHLWETLTSDGGAPSRCGWLKDRFGLSWQVVPKDIASLMTGTPDDPQKGERTMAALLKMDKLDIATLRAA